MFRNISAKIKLSAWVVLIIGGLCSLISGIICFVLAGQLNAAYYGISGMFSSYSRGGAPGTSLVFIGIFIIIFGGILSYVAALLVHGYAQIIKNTQVMAGNAGGEAGKEPSIKGLFTEAFHTAGPQPADPAYAQPAPQPQAPVYTAPAPQPQTPVYTAPAPQPADPAYAQPAPQPQAPVYTAPAPQPVTPPEVFEQPETVFVKESEEAEAVAQPAAEAAGAAVQPETEAAEAAEQPETEAAGAAVQPETEAAEATAQPEAEEAEAFCEVCGRKIPEGAAFCSGCGTKLK